MKNICCFIDRMMFGMIVGDLTIAATVKRGPSPDPYMVCVAIAASFL